MNPLQPFFNMKVGMIDLSVSSTEVVSLDQGKAAAYLGGASLNRIFIEGDRHDTLIFGTGPLTGSFAPASALLVATFKSPRFGKICHVPFMLSAGPDMKFSGLDFLVIQGGAAEPSVLFIHRGGVRISPAGNLQGLSIPELITALKRDYPPFRSAIVTGPAGDRGMIDAAASVGGKGGIDKAGLASRMAAKNIKAILFRGSGGLPFRNENPEQSRELITKIAADKNYRHRGFLSLLDKLEGGKEAGKHLGGLRKKDLACYHCPFPCMTHVEFTRQDAPRGKDGKIKEGLLLLDHLGWIALVGKFGKDALTSLRNCLQEGLDPGAALAPGGEFPRQAHILFGGGIAPIPPGDLWGKRVALAMILGICPLFLLMFPRIDERDLLAFIAPHGDLGEAMHKNLTSAIESLLTA